MRRLWLVVAAVLALPAPAAAQVLVVGDSLEEGTGPHLERELSDLAVTIDARRSRPSGEGLDVLRTALRPEHEVVVFDLGTNDSPSQPESLAANLRAARDLAGGRCLVVASIQRPPLNGVTVDGLDGAVRDFAAETPTAQLVDWRAATTEPGVLAGDGVHATPDGYALRAKLVAEGVRACLEPAPHGAARPPAACAETGSGGAVPDARPANRGARRADHEPLAAVHVRRAERGRRADPRHPEPVLG